jgi:hypothetical protein
MVSGINNIELWNQVKPELQNGEELLWVGKPMPLRVVLANGDLISTVISLAMIVFMYVFFSRINMSTFSRSSSPAEILSWFPLILFAFGLFTLSRPVYAFIMAFRTIYGLTDHRALIIKHTFSGKSVDSYTEMDQLERTDIANGKGDLVFQREISRYRSNGRTRTRTRKIGFFGVENVREVEAMMLRTLREKEGTY